MKWILGVLLVVGLPCDAQVIPDGQAYRCVSKNGPVRYQSTPCDNKQLTTRVYQVDQDRASAYQRQQIEDDAQRRMQANRRLSEAAGTNQRFVYTGPTNYQRSRSKCESAKADRERYLKRNPNAGYNARTRWNDMVWEACKGL